MDKQQLILYGAATILALKSLATLMAGHRKQYQRQMAAELAAEKQKHDQQHEAKPATQPAKKAG